MRKDTSTNIEVYSNENDILVNPLNSNNCDGRINEANEINRLKKF
jgi:hypothetical protein